MILYEYPFSERLRTFLRLEQLCRHLDEMVQRDSALDHHYALGTLFELMDVAARADLKSDVLKELERHKQQLDSYRGNPSIAEATLDQFISQLQAAFTALNQMNGKAGQSLTDIDWLMALRSRMAIPGGTCGFDLPIYHTWKHQPSDKRRADLQQWASATVPLSHALKLLMALLRDSGHTQTVRATKGHLQQTLPAGRSYQLLRLHVDPALGVVPEISGNRLMVSVRLMRADYNGKLVATTEDADLALTLCA